MIGLLGFAQTDGDLTYRRLHDSLGAHTVVVPGHGRTMRRSDVLHSIGYVEDSMYDFIHFQGNIPAVLSTD